ncbi:sensor domain-containing diguanylate cyclase [Oceanispirochaeta sp. M1]|nr:sensor domain-containing diguanylate cyclase [Oceanispirochaeta sp. M1]MBF9014928.1 GGDEF domain-containing protein [Oceanispirochaeta sp. M2]NPD71391.1 GGDEF domain-containing protein [Oceanispirochaeta sp. M1]
MTMTKSRISIKILIMVITSSFLFSSLFSYFQAKQSLRDEILSSSLPLLSENIYSELRHELSVPINVSSSMARDSFLMNWVLDGENEIEDIKLYLGNLKSRYGFFSTFFVSSSSRNYYYYDGILKQISPYDSHDIWYYDFINSQKELDLDVDTDQASNGVLTVFINYRLEDFSGNFLGVVGVGVRLDQLSDLLKQKKTQYDRDIYLVDEEGIIQVHSDLSLIEKINIFKEEGISSVAEQLMETEEFPIDLIYKKKNDHFLVSSKSIPEIGWHVIVEQNEERGSFFAKRSLFINLLLTAAITVLLIIASYKILKSFEQQMELLASTDSLTNAANRRELEKQFKLLEYRSKRFNSDLSLILIDLDDFKSINDNYGHIAGDTVLKEVTFTLQKSIRPIDLLARWGGDEFVILIEAPRDEAALKADRMVHSFDKPSNVVHNGKEVPVSISAGVAVFKEGDSLKSLIEKADKALLHSKAKGKNCVTLSD